MKSAFLRPLFIAGIVVSAFSAIAQTDVYPPVATVAKDFKRMLQKPVPVFRPSLQQQATDSVLIEKGFIHADEHELIPLLVYKPLSAGRHPAVIVLHGTGGRKDGADIKDILYRLTKAGITGIAIDARYHGERVAGGAHSSTAYVEAIAKAWDNKDAAHQAHPFYFDTVSDLWLLMDYLSTRPDIDTARIGMTGISMGGIETWMAASADRRVKVAVPIIGVQSFRWSLEHDRWQGRAHTIWAAHQHVAAAMGDTSVNRKNVQALWDKLLPGITGEFDCPSLLRLFAPRPLLILNNEKDPNCPLPGAEIAFDEARAAYKAANATDKLEIMISPNEPHRLLPIHVEKTVAFFAKWL
ncbi:MAG: dienelactone hydrolase family protein [Bacteroidetes bacterium]|nr:dienelactone hydrolase family protein [Bacteroidota bacterium]